MKRCNLCGLSNTARCIKIPGRGASEPLVMFIGQAPGQEEDERGQCFIGPAGQLLVQAINTFKLKPAYVTNLCKCFPPEDRDPKTEEIKACMPYLMNEIEHRNPKFIVTLGNIATKHVLGLKACKITELSGKTFKLNGRTVMPLLHPSYILRYNHNLHIFEGHLRSLSRLIRGKDKEKPKLIKVSAERAFQIMCVEQKWKFVAFDFETTGITKDSCGQIRCVSFSNGKKSLWVDAIDHGFDELMKKFINSTIKKVAHNASFEMRVCKEVYGKFPKNVHFDTMAWHYLTDETASHNLESVAMQYLHVDPWDITLDMEQNCKTYADYDIEKLGKYCAVDSLYTARIYLKMIKSNEDELKAFNRDVFRKIISACARMSYDGIYFDRKYALELKSQYESEMDGLKERFQQTPVLKDWFKRRTDFNLNSSTQIREVFCKKLKLPIKELTEGKQISVKESALEEFRSTHGAVAVYLDWKKRKTILDNFIVKLAKFTDGNGFIHANFNPCLVVTGRLSVTKPPLQAIPLDERVRGMFSSRFKNGLIGAFDFKQLEMRLVASESDEQKLIDVFINKGDPHDETAKLIFGNDFTKQQRAMAKRINFGVVYGIQEFTLAKDFNMSIESAAKLLEKYNSAYPKIYTWMHRQREFVRRNGYIKSRFGRKRRLGRTDNMPEWERSRIERQAGNFPIQSLGADITNLSLIAIIREFIKQKLKSKVVLQVHDSIIVDIYPDEKEIVKAICMIKMARVVPKLKCPWLNVPLDVDAKIQKRWGV